MKGGVLQQQAAEQVLQQGPRRRDNQTKGLTGPCTRGCAIVQPCADVSAWQLPSLVWSSLLWLQLATIRQGAWETYCPQQPQLPS